MRPLKPTSTHPYTFAAILSLMLLVAGCGAPEQSGQLDATVTAMSASIRILSMR